MQSADAATAYAQRHGLGEPRLVRSSMNDVFRCGQEILRISAAGRQPGAVALAEHLLSQGLPVAQPTRAAVIIEDREITGWVLVDGAGSPDVTRLGRTIRRLHDLPADTLPGEVPRPWCGSFAHLQLIETLTSLEDDLPAHHHEALARSVADLDWEDTARQAPRVLCHGDVHLQNVLWGTQGMVLIDWDLLCTGPAAWDHGPLLAGRDRWNDPDDAYPAFAAGYGHDLSADDLAQGIARLRNLAATVMLAKHSVTDASVSDEFERRMRYWHGDPDAPRFTAR